MDLKRIILSMAAVAVMMPVTAEEAQTDEKILNLRVEARADWQGAWLDGHTEKDYTGFAAKYLNLRLEGNLTPNLSYAWRQRFTKPHKDSSFLDATDWLYLNYNLDNWVFAGGKQVVAIGGWEYDRPPIDCYGCSVFWNNIPCYALGGTIGFRPTVNDKISFQLSQSPFFTTDNRNMYGYNLMWNGQHGIFTSIWSANLIEYLPGRYINYIALGNRFDVEKVSLELDLMNRASSHQVFFGKDMSVMAELKYKPTGRWAIFGKYTYDVNKSGTDADFTVLDGTELNMAGAGVEFMPFVNSRNSLRFHATGFYAWGHNANEANLMQNKTFTCNVGVTWYMNVLSLRRK